MPPNMSKVVKSTEGSVPAMEEALRNGATVDDVNLVRWHLGGMRSGGDAWGRGRGGGAW